MGTDDEDENDELSEAISDGLDDIWNEMKVALECSKVFSSQFHFGKFRRCCECYTLLMTINLLNCRNLLASQYQRLRSMQKSLGY